MPLEKAVSSTHVEMFLHMLDIYQLHVVEGEDVRVLWILETNLKGPA